MGREGRRRPWRRAPWDWRCCSFPPSGGGSAPGARRSRGNGLRREGRRGAERPIFFGSSKNCHWLRCRGLMFSWFDIFKYIKKNTLRGHQNRGTTPVGCDVRRHPGPLSQARGRPPGWDHVTGQVTAQWARTRGPAGRNHCFKMVKS